MNMKWIKVVCVVLYTATALLCSYGIFQWSSSRVETFLSSEEGIKHVKQETHIKIVKKYGLESALAWMTGARGYISVENEVVDSFYREPFILAFSALFLFTMVGIFLRRYLNN